MRKLLYISYFAPYDTVDHAGGKVHNFYLKKLQVEKEFDVTLLTMCYQREVEKLDFEKYGIDNRLVVLDSSKKERYKRIILSGFSYINPWDAYGGVLLNYERLKIKKMIREYQKNNEIPDIIILQWTQIILLMPFIRKLYPEVPVVAIEEDVLFLNFFRRISLNKKLFFRLIAKYRYHNMKRRELDALNSAQLVVVNNPKDGKLLLENRFPKEKLFVSSIYFENYFRVKRNLKNKDILFYGAMYRQENHMSAMWFIKNVLPLLPKEYRFVVAGARPEKALLAQRSERVEVLGFVESIEKYFSESLCMVAPLVLGAGIKVKILEAMSAGIPVITNEIGIEGIEATDREEYWHCNEPREYAETIMWIDNHKREAEMIAEKGKKHVAGHFDLQSRYQALIREIEEIS